MVILTNLDRLECRDAFEVMPESYGDGFDRERPLVNRRIRYWPWPFGATKQAPLAERAEQSPEGREVALREDKERARLLYVGLKPARDHLVLAARAGKGGAKTAWLDGLCDEDGPLVSLPVASDDSADAETCIRTAGGPLRVATRVFRLERRPSSERRGRAQPSGSNDPRAAAARWKAWRGKKVDACWAHLPVGGAMVEVGV